MVIDILFFCIAGIGFMVGYRQGVIKLILTVFSVFVGFMLTIRFTPDMNQLLIDFFDMNSVIMPVLAFVLTFIVAMIFIRVAGQFAESFFKNSNLGEFNQVAGGALMAIVGLFLYSGVIWFLMKADILENFTLEEQTKMRLLKKKLAEKEQLDQVKFNDETLEYRDSDIFNLNPSEEDLFAWDMTEEEYQKLAKAIAKRKDSRTLPFIETFLFQFDNFMIKTAEMFTELFKDVEIFWKESAKGE